MFVNRVDLEQIEVGDEVQYFKAGDTGFGTVIDFDGIVYTIEVGGYDEATDTYYEDFIYVSNHNDIYKL